MSNNINRRHIISTFHKLGFNVDHGDVHITVLRETEFPFRRLTLPNRSAISSELLQIYLNDLNLESKMFIAHLKTLTNNAGQNNNSKP